VAQPAPNLGELGEQLIRSTGLLAAECQSAIEACTASVRASGDRVKESLASVAPSRPPAALWLLPAARPPEVAEPAPVAAAPAESPARAGMLWLPLAIGGFAVTLPLAGLLALALALRRGGLQFRVELVSSSAAGLPLVARLEPAWQAGPAPAAAAAPPAEAPRQEEPPSGEQFDLGPSYEEEQQAKDESLRLQEQAVLQQIFEDNLRLQEEAGPLAPREGPALAGEGDRQEREGQVD
jgi:hypothetical protein